MRFKHYIILLFLLSLGLGGGTVFFVLQKNLPLSVISVFIALFLVYYTLSLIFKPFRDIDDFTEAVGYRDFSKRYAVTRKYQSYLYPHFNRITDTFLGLSRDKEAQHQYLKLMLELVNTGILAYDLETMDTLLMNDSFKSMFHLPFLQNINWLKSRNPILYKTLIDIRLGENRLVAVNMGNRTVKTLCNACTFQMQDKTYSLIAFHDINATLEEVESGAWKGLLNVMTHEIMNSIAPVASLADAMKKRMGALKEDLDLQDLPDFEDMESAMETIRRRSEGLLRFADTYRNLSKTIIPEMHPVNLHELLKSIHRLMQPSLTLKGIKLEVKTDNADVSASIDRNLIEQVVINFITNATYAVKERENPMIVLFSGQKDEDPCITVADNGCGISPEIRDKIFIPFFSTKKSGSGIGLSLSREIVKLHNGTLQLQTKEDEGSAFTIRFNKL